MPRDTGHRLGDSLGAIMDEEAVNIVANRRITDLSDYTALLPDVSELLGVYRPLGCNRSDPCNVSIRRRSGNDGSRSIVSLTGSLAELR